MQSLIFPFNFIPIPTFMSFTICLCLSDICVAPESQGGFEREQIREQLGGMIGRFSMGRLRRFLSGIIYGNPFRAGNVHHSYFCILATV